MSQTVKEQEAQLGNAGDEKTYNSKLLYLSKSDIIQLSEGSSNLFVDSVSHALREHANGNFVQPLKPYLKWYGSEGHIADRIIAMPAYIGGEQSTAGLKWVGSKHDNPSKRGLDRASAVIILNDTVTHFPVAIIEGSYISGMRTAAVTSIAAKYLAKSDFKEVSIIGCGPIAQMQLTTLLEQFPQVAHIHLFDLNPAAAQRLQEKLVSEYEGLQVTSEASVEDAVRKAEVLITSTVTDKPYIEADWVNPGTFISNISIMDLHKEVFLKADKVIVDDWDQSNREKKVINQLVLEGKFSKEDLHAELGEIVLGNKAGRESDEEIIVLNPMGMAIEDIACAQAVYDRARELNIGIELDLF